MNCGRLGELVLRGDASPDGIMYGCVAAGTFGQFAYELVTAFSNGATLTTSTTPGLEDRKARRLYKRSYPDLTVEHLQAKHAAGIAEIASNKARPVAIEPTLEGFCRAVDAYIEREL